MSKFIIDNIELNCDYGIVDQLEVSSIPNNYIVNFTNFKPSFNNHDFVLIDKNIGMNSKIMMFDDFIYSSPSQTIHFWDHPDEKYRK